MSGFTWDYFFNWKDEDLAFTTPIPRQKSAPRNAPVITSDGDGDVAIGGTSAPTSGLQVTFEGRRASGSTDVTFPDPRSPRPVLCRFCGKVAEGTYVEEGGEIVFRNLELISFLDFRPASRLHVLVVPTAHIRSVLSLTTADIPLLESMIDLVNCIMDSNGRRLNDAEIADQPHLHLHGIAWPPKPKRYISYVHVPGAFQWWVDAAEVLINLKNALAVGETGAWDRSWMDKYRYGPARPVPLVNKLYPSWLPWYPRGGKKPKGLVGEMGVVEGELPPQGAQRERDSGVVFTAVLVPPGDEELSIGKVEIPLVEREDLQTAPGPAPAA
ncbi:hypothetical protein HDU96_007926 [Phlyctochytrium bullatum]|nr:hypothetical protein HDU96_007926 [Phlyctochytrium bullatum]